MDYTKDALQYIVGLKSAELKEIGGMIYTDKSLSLVTPPSVNERTVHTLTSLIDMVKAELFKFNAPVFVHVVSPCAVEVFDSIRDGFHSRETPFSADAGSILPDISLNRFLSAESAIIQLKSKFAATKERDLLISLLGNITEENVRNTADDGISQQVTARKGVSMKENKTVPSVIKLSPYRTFREVEQPTSDFLVRLHDGPEIALYEADGGAWKLEACQSIKTYLAAAFDGTDDVIVIA